MPLDPLALFHRPPRALWLEIGFGGGEHLAALAAAHPDVGFLGVEPFINGVAKLLRAVEAGPLANVRILKDDARLLLEVAAHGQPGAGLSSCFLTRGRSCGTTSGGSSTGAPWPIWHG